MSTTQNMSIAKYAVQLQTLWEEFSIYNALSRWTCGKCSCNIVHGAQIQAQLDEGHLRHFLFSGDVDFCFGNMTSTILAHDL